MRVISKRRLREFWLARRHDTEIAKRDLSAWYKTVIHATWANFASLKQTFGSADQVGNCVVFDVGNNRFRLIARVNCKRGIVYVLQVLDHQEYDRQRWIAECGCHNPPPARARLVLKSKPPHGKRKRRR